MGLQNQMNKTTRRASNAAPLAMVATSALSVEDFLATAEVPILDDDVLLDDDYFEPDGVNDFVRDAEAWDPDREF